ncbi:hypothetical protein CKAH01_12053 [Colletotrichum kahawae]|uniref:DUF6536 domain-containing protein n=1 Tax=Colletotrichum kahawae TaxID=34407 RepID=A0AAD9YT82_COLKA|nr:hypothetical protein CKAH01_12053 [Colletotrichum kahawae]
MPTFSAKAQLTRGFKNGFGWLPSGWRRSAVVNIGLMSIVLLILLGVLAVAVSKTGGDFRQSWKFYDAECRGSNTSTANTLLHLLINILSTTILASSNFFMQVLNAPSRLEVDAAHARGIWLDIGIPSWRNAFYLSYFKLFTWLSLFITSIPIHMLFNSSVFHMHSLMGDFHLTIATESFLHGAPYSLPGASLLTNELLSEAPKKKAEYEYYGFGTEFLVPTFQDFLSQNYAAQAKYTSKTAAQAKTWNRLEAKECSEIYGSECKGLRDYRDVVLVTKGSGWRRADLWNLSIAADELWEPIVPRDQLKTLWCDTQ